MNSSEAGSVYSLSGPSSKLKPLFHIFTTTDSSPERLPSSMYSWLSSKETTGLEVDGFPETFTTGSESDSPRLDTETITYGVIGGI